MIPSVTRKIRNFNKWRLVLALFLLIYFVLLIIDLDYNTIQWDETPHLNGGLLLSRGQFQEYVETEAFYPPAFDIVTGFFFKILGPSAFSARMVAVIFSILCIWTVYETASEMYGSKTALLASILLASMPGFIWLSRMALLETMLLFFFSLSLFLFFSWMCTNNTKTLILTGITLGLAVLVKYQALVGGIVMLMVLLVFGKQKIQNKLGTILVIGVVTAVIVLPWFLVAYQQYTEKILETWIYSLQMGNESRLAYSTRMPLPIFYLIEMVWPFSYMHPISIFSYIFTLLGLAFIIKRRNNEDKIFALGFFVIYFVFTLITSKDWRYITLIFPILAISGSEFVLSAYGKAKDTIKLPQMTVSKKRLTKVFATIFILLVSFSILFSIWESYLWLEVEHFNVPVRDACQYVSENSEIDETAVAFFTTNYFSVGMMRFYLELYDSGQRNMLEFPQNAVDVYKPVPNDERFFFSLNKAIQRFEATNVKYLLLAEWKEKYYFKTFYDSSDVLENLNVTGHFAIETEFGSFPHRMFIIRFLPSS